MLKIRFKRTNIFENIDQSSLEAIFHIHLKSWLFCHYIFEAGSESVILIQSTINKLYMVNSQVEVCPQ